tara:strand:+ start:115 stop:1245 length:1131 start_codon:yes stop_codon:yes gene_type:complete
MSDKRPNVFPTQEQISQANETGEQIANQLAEQEDVQQSYGSEQEQKAAEEMRRRTEEQIKMREEQLRKNEEIARQMDEKRSRQSKETLPYVQQPVKSEPPNVPPIDPPNFNNNDNSDDKPKKVDDNYIRSISQPQMNQPFDVIPLPSEGKLYPRRNKTVKVSFMTTADENILTSPNLMESGEFLEILINRKLLEPDLRYKDLLPGDRNAIMIWLRATGYGEMYPILVYDEKEEVFETEVNLSDLKQIPLNVEPNSEGLFDFQLPISKANIVFKMLTVGELEELGKTVEATKDLPVNEEATLILEAQIVAVDGNGDRDFIKNFVRNMRVGDAQKLRDYFDKIECGVDMNLTVRTPGGGSVETFLPFTPKFFWPNSEI